MSRQRRRFFRLRLPLNDRISARIDGHRYLIRELSEGGMRVAPTDLRVAALPVGERVSAELMFHDGSRLTIEGTIERRDAEEWVIVGVAGVSFARMLSRATAAGKEIPPYLVTRSASEEKRQFSRLRFGFLALRVPLASGYCQPPRLTRDGQSCV